MAIRVASELRAILEKIEVLLSKSPLDKASLTAAPENSARESLWQRSSRSDSYHKRFYKRLVLIAREK